MYVITECARKMLESCSLESQKVSYKLPKMKNLLLRFLDIFTQMLVKSFIYRSS